MRSIRIRIQALYMTVTIWPRGGWFWPSYRAFKAALESEA